MKSLHFLSSYIFLFIGTLLIWPQIVKADQNIYKKDFDSTGKAYYFNPSPSMKDYKIAVGEDCTKVVVTLVGPDGVLASPSLDLPLSKASGYTYSAEMIRYPGGKCALPDSQKYNKQVIQSKPEDLVNYYNGKTGPLAEYSFKTENKVETGGLFSNKWVLIGVIGGIVLVVIILIAIIAYCRKSKKDENWIDKRYSKRLSSEDGDQKGTQYGDSKFSDPMMSVKDRNGSFNIGAPYNTSVGGFNSPMNTNLKSPYVASAGLGVSPALSTKNINKTSPNKGDDSFLVPPAGEPKRITSLTFEEQQNYSNLIAKHQNSTGNPRNGKSPKPMNANSPLPSPAGMPGSAKLRHARDVSVPEEYERLKTYVVISKFMPKRDDELKANIGQMVKMIKSFEDEWCLCYNIDTRHEGYIPIKKLAIADAATMANINSIKAKGPPAKPTNPYKQYSNGIPHSNSQDTTTSSTYSTKPLLDHSSSNASSYGKPFDHNNSNASNYSSNGNYQRKPSNASNGGRGINNRNNSGSRGNDRSPPRNNMQNPNKYYRKPSTDNSYNNYGNGNGYGRSPYM